jgi:hypothetical protein
MHQGIDPAYGGALHKMLDRKGKEIILRMGRREVFHTDDEGNSRLRKLVSSPLVGED